MHIRRSTSALVCTRAALGWPRWKVAVECDEEADTPGYREWVHSHTAELEARGWSVIWVTKTTAEGRGSPGIVVLRAQEKLWAAQRSRAGRSARVPRSGEDDFVRSRARSVD